MSAETEATAPSLPPSPIDDLKLASSTMTGATRRSFQAKMALKDCAGNARQAERVFGWGGETVQLGLHDQRTGVTSLGAQKACCGKPLWEDQHPDVARVLLGVSTRVVTTGSNVPHRAVVHPIDGGGSAEDVASVRRCRRRPALSHDSTPPRDLGYPSDRFQRIGSQSWGM